MLLILNHKEHMNKVSFGSVQTTARPVTGLGGTVNRKVTLCAQFPGRFNPCQRKTLAKRVKIWRRDAAPAAW
jgi:hypothetical protein